MKNWNSPAGQLKLERYPFKGELSHQAWDSADEWIVKHFPEQNKPVLITGEAFGVLGTVWGKSSITACGDSHLAFSALMKNRSLNPENTGGELKLLPSTDHSDSDKVFGRIFIRIPKDLSLMEYYLKHSLRFADADSEIWLGAMDKRWSSGVKKITENLLATEEVFPFERHSRWIRFSRLNAQDRFEAAIAPSWNLEKFPLKFHAAPAVFSSTGLDAGTSAFLWAFPENQISAADSIADLGCGSGILGISAAYLNPNAALYFTDESYLAVRNAEDNYKQNNLTGQADFMAAHGLEGVKDDSLDLVLCNPPFHFQNIQSREPARFLFEEARRTLRPGGCIQVVGNNHLGYHKLLKELFSNTDEVYQNSKFTVLRAVKA
ncbi:MAG: methyltransferase [Spirochaetales bacterium]|nr:methyltransferase [Spirochaetales bacterium]